MEPAELLEVPPAELVDVNRLSVDQENPNRMSARQFQALKKSIRSWGFIVPIITNRDYLIADGEHRLKAAKALGMKQVSVVRLPVDDVDRRMIRQVMNKIRGEHDLFLDAEEYRKFVDLFATTQNGRFSKNALVVTISFSSNFKFGYVHNHLERVDNEY